VSIIASLRRGRPETPCPGLHHGEQPGDRFGKRRIGGELRRPRLPEVEIPFRQRREVGCVRAHASSIASPRGAVMGDARGLAVGCKSE